MPAGQDLMIAATATRCYDSVFRRSGPAGALRSRSLMRRTELVWWARDRRRGRRVGFHVFGLARYKGGFVTGPKKSQQEFPTVVELSGLMYQVGTNVFDRTFRGFLPLSPIHL